MANRGGSRGTGNIPGSSRRHKYFIHINQGNERIPHTTFRDCDGNLVLPEVTAQLYCPKLTGTTTEEGVSLQTATEHRARMSSIKDSEYQKFLTQAATVDTIFRKELEATKSCAGGRDNYYRDMLPAMEERQRIMEQISELTAQLNELMDCSF
ncbi:ORF4 [Wisteria badnavirus 1]|uniref:ORF4 n=1 Tax=Wisteria badnavirus 1 TaxID=1973265 RepID=A0A1U9IRR6_9VIRU|nr:ORF4 [Wisteria badnavirus 1]AQM50988.1 ORF4 [Wisteria badnavirus 1]